MITPAFQSARTPTSPNPQSLPNTSPLPPAPSLALRPRPGVIRANQGPEPVPIIELICIVAQWLKRLEVNPD